MTGQEMRIFALSILIGFTIGLLVGIAGTMSTGKPMQATFAAVGAGAGISIGYAIIEQRREKNR